MNARNVTLSLGSGEARVDILKGINLEVRQGETVALLGPSGSGKSSLMAVLAGLERASGGTIETGGQDFGTLDEDGLAKARRGRIGIILQAFHLLPTMTALENVAVPLELAGLEDPFGRAAAELERVGLAGRTGHYPVQLSGGEQQMLAISRALMARPRVLLLDEPSLGLAPLIIKQIFEIIKKINQEQKTTVFLVEQNANQALKLADRGYVMENGHITLTDTAANLLDNEQVKSAYLGL